MSITFLNSTVTPSSSRWTSGPDRSCPLAPITCRTPAGCNSGIGILTSRSYRPFGRPRDLLTPLEKAADVKCPFTVVTFASPKYAPECSLRDTIRLVLSGSVYLAFNKALQVEAEGKFPKHVTCKTTHGLAYKQVIGEFHRNGSKLSDKLNGNKVGARGTRPSAVHGSAAESARAATQPQAPVRDSLFRSMIKRIFG